MSHICRFHSYAILCILLPTAEAEPQQWFPELRGSHVRLTAEWQNSPIVAVGEVVNVRRYGTKTYSGLSYPAPPGAHEVYWCVGDFRATAVVKGSLDAAPQSYLFTSDPDCREIYGSVRGKNPKTRVWFLRIERGFLRPVYDYGTYRYFALLGRWDEDPRLRPRQRLGALLLTPRANTTTLKDLCGLSLGCRRHRLRLAGEGGVRDTDKAARETRQPCAATNGVHLPSGPAPRGVLTRRSPRSYGGIGNLTGMGPSPPYMSVDWQTNRIFLTGIVYGGYLPGR